jgi:hypothetical protein
MRKIFLFLLLFASFACEAKDMGLTYTIQPGDTLTEIAEKECGSWREYASIAEYNFAKIENPDRIYPGINIIVPCKITNSQENVQVLKTSTDVNPKIFKEEPALLAHNIQNIPTSQLGEIAPAAVNALAVVPVATEIVSDEIAKMQTFAYSEMSMTTLINILEREANVASNSTNSTSQLSQFAQIETVDATENVPVVTESKNEVVESSAPLNTVQNNVAKSKTVKVKKPKAVKKNYLVAFNATGVKPGSYPAILLKSQDKNGEWKHRQNMTVKVEETNDTTLCMVILDKKPQLNSAVVINFSGNAIVIGGDILIQGEMAEIAIPKKLAGKFYKDLKTAFPTKRNPVLAAIRTFAPTGISSGLAYAAMGPMGLISAPAAFAGDLLVSKIRRDQKKLDELSAPKLNVQYQVAGQQSQIDSLKKQIEALQAKIENLQQPTAASTSSNSISDKGIGQ